MLFKRHLQNVLCPTSKKNQLAKVTSWVALHELGKSLRSVAQRSPSQ